MFELMARYPGPCALTFFVGLLCGVVGTVSALARRGLMLNERQRRAALNLAAAVGNCPWSDGKPHEDLRRTYKEFVDAHT